MGGGPVGRVPPAREGLPRVILQEHRRSADTEGPSDPRLRGTLERLRQNLTRPRMAQDIVHRSGYPAPSRAPALMIPAPHVLVASGSHAPPGNGVNIPEDLIFASTCAGVSEGFCDSISATTPETCGVAMLVPL